MATELDEELGGVSEKIGAATRSGVGPDSDTALDALIIGDIPKRRERKATDSASSSASASQPPLSAPVQGAGKPRAGSRAEMLARMAELEKTIAELRAENAAMKARENGEAVQELGGLIAMALTVSSQFIAERRGPHWLFDNDTESKPIGDAWAFALAPYADQIKQYAPWAMALGVTWMVVKPKLDEDKRLMLERAEREKAQQELPLAD